MPDQTTLEKFRLASDLLGGREATARALGMSDRSLRYLLAGQREIHTGLLEDISKALIDHAERCRALERQLSPVYAANLQGVHPPHHRSAHAMRKVHPLPPGATHLIVEISSGGGRGGSSSEEQD